MGDLATSPLLRDMAFEPSVHDEVIDERRLSTSSYGSSSGRAQEHAGHLHDNKTGSGRGSTSSAEGYNESSHMNAAGAADRRRPGSSHATIVNNNSRTRPRTSGSEASSVRSTKSIANSSTHGDTAMTGERSPSV
jgi:hypothetical protein